MATCRPPTPHHLAPLVEGTPLSLEKLRGAWPALVFAEKMQLLSTLLGDPADTDNAGVLKWKRHRNFVRAIALADDNEYIRYFAALKVSSQDKDPGSVVVYERVLADPSSLVLSSQDHWGLSAFLFPTGPQQPANRFWRLSGPRRLAVAADMLGSDIAKCLLFAVRELLPEGTVALGDLQDVVHQFIGASKSSRQKDAEDLWNIVPDLPTELSLILVDMLPPVAGSELPQTLLNRFTEDHIHVLLARDEIGLNELRRTTFNSTSKVGLLHAAVSSTKFPILDSDISAVFANPADSAIKAVALAQSGKGATLVQKQALRWFVEKHHLDKAWVQFQAEKHLKARSLNLAAKKLGEEILQMRLFEFSASICEAGVAQIRERYGQDRSMRKLISEYAGLEVADNPWETYLNWRNAVRDLASLRLILPHANDEYYLDRKDLPPDF